MRISDWSSDVCSSDLGIAALFEHARRCAAEAGIDLQDLKTGGGSDGNFTAAPGVPTLDGLGVDGMGGHTENEQLYYSSLEPRRRCGCASTRRWNRGRRRWPMGRTNRKSTPKISSPASSAG